MQRRRWTGTLQFPFESFTYIFDGDERYDSFYCCCGAVTSTLSMCIHEVGPEMCRCHCWFMLSYIFTSVFVSFFAVAVKAASHALLHVRHTPFVSLARAHASSGSTYLYPLSKTNVANAVCNATSSGPAARNPHPIPNANRELPVCTQCDILFNVNTSFRRRNDKMHYHFKVHSSFSLHIRIWPACMQLAARCCCNVSVDVIQFMQCASVWFDFFFHSLLSFIFASLSTDLNWTCVASGREIETEGKGIKANQVIWMVWATE